MRSLETKRAGYWTGADIETESLDALLADLSVPQDGRMYGIEKAFALGATVEQLFDATKIDPWFLDQFQQIHELGEKLRAAESFDEASLRQAKYHGISDPPDRGSAPRTRW